MSNKLVLVSFLDKAPDKKFKTSEWPLHMTLLPPFTTNDQLESLTDQLNNIAKESEPFSIKIVGEALFGPKENIPVSLVETEPRLSKLHMELSRLAMRLGLEYEHPFLHGNKYRFHVTDQRGQKAPSDIAIPISGFSLVDRQADSEIGVKKVLRTFELE